ncbi:hypothetical protein BDV06DRAFT_226579 [Aspergillus oleicola]
MPYLMIGIRKDHPDIDPAEYIAYLHTKDTCYSFTTIYGEDSGKWELHPEQLTLKSSEHLEWCDYLAKKQVVGRISEHCVEAVCDTFKDLEKAYGPKTIRESQFTVFRFLWICVDGGIIREEDVKRVIPKFERKRGGMRDVDWRS